MKKTVISALALLLICCMASAQSQKKAQLPEYTFTVEKANPITSIKNQYRSGTCWCYSTISFVESEIIRINNIKDEAAYPDFSEMFVVSKSYLDRADKFVRLNGNLTFGAGSQSEDVLHVISDYGLVPQEAMPGMNYGTKLPEQAELDAVLKSYAEVIANNPNKKITTAWKRGYEAVLDSYLGDCPETFEVGGKQYTPASYRDALKFNPEDYVAITSYTHHPFYTWFAVEVADNWRWDASYNVPIDEMMAVIDNTIEKGGTIAWGTDVSSAGFTRDGLAVFIDEEATKAAGSDQEHWVGKSEEEAKKIDVVVEVNPTQESRQIDFDNQTMTDDHGMQIYGTARDQFGKRYYMVKNSWGVTGKYDGIWYATEAFVKGQTLSILVHKDFLTPGLKKHLGIK